MAARSRRTDPAKWEKVASLFHWTTFKSLNNVVFLKMSYGILVGAPLLAAYLQTPFGEFFEGMPFALKVGYFSSLSLSIAHMLYQAFCPPIIKRFDSPNDLYRDLLEIKTMQARWLPFDDQFEFDREHCRTGYANKNEAHTIARIATGVFYYEGLALAASVVADQALRVATA